MPHVVLTGKLSISEIFDKLDNLIHRREGQILKTGTKYLASEKNSIIIESTVIEPEKAPVNFFVLVNGREDGLVVRIHPTTDPEKTDAVKKILAEIAKKIMANYPDAKIGKTNLQEFLD